MKAASDTVRWIRWKWRTCRVK